MVTFQSSDMEVYTGEKLHISIRISAISQLRTLRMMPSRLSYYQFLFYLLGLECHISSIFCLNFSDYLPGMQIICSASLQFPTLAHLWPPWSSKGPSLPRLSPVTNIFKDFVVVGLSMLLKFFSSVLYCLLLPKFVLLIWAFFEESLFLRASLKVNHAAILVLLELHSNI